MILIIISVIAANCVSHLLQLWLTPLIARLHRPKCPKCKKRIDMPLYSLPCLDCASEDSSLSSISCPPPLSTVEVMKDMLRDEEGMKLMCKMIGLQTEREKFEEESDREL